MNPDRTNPDRPKDDKICKLHEGMLRDIHLAVCGNKQIGVDGLVNDVREIKAWRRGVDLRVAKVSGLVTGILFLGKYLWTKF